MIKYKIIATKKQLDDIGISYDINNHEGILKKKYPTGWYSLAVKHTYGKNTFTNIFDIPKTFLKKI